MKLNVTIFFLFAVSMSVISCGSSTNSNGGPASASNINSNTAAPAAVNLDPANLPPGLSASPMQQPGNLTGVNANVIQPKGGTPTPGIPSPQDLKKPFKPGATPTPGIPSPEEIRKMLGKPPTNVNASGPPMKGGDVPMMKSNKPTAGKPKP